MDWLKGLLGSKTGAAVKNNVQSEGPEDLGHWRPLKYRDAFNKILYRLTDYDIQLSGSASRARLKK
jgi:hypothetical protein